MNDFQDQQDSNKPKQFYAINLTPERIFLIFIVFLIIISSVIVIVAFTINRGSARSADLSDSEYAFLDTITAHDYYESEIPTYQEQATTPNDAPSQDAAQSELEIQQTKRALAHNEVPSQDGPQTIVLSDAPDKVKVGNEVLYSSSLTKEATQKTKVSPTAKSTPPAKTEAAPAKKPASTTTTPVVAKKPAQTEKFVIQIASYSTNQAAQNVFEFYKKAGYVGYVKAFEKDGKTFYRLRLGPYDTQEIAATTLTKVKASSYGKDAYISKGYF